MLPPARCSRTHWRRRRPTDTRAIAIDLAELEFIDTHCLSILFDTHERLRECGGDLMLMSPQPAVRRLLHILRRQDLIEL